MSVLRSSRIVLMAAGAGLAFLSGCVPLPNQPFLVPGYPVTAPDGSTAYYVPAYDNGAAVYGYPYYSYPYYGGGSSLYLGYSGGWGGSPSYRSGFGEGHGGGGFSPATGGGSHSDGRR